MHRDTTEMTYGEYVEMMRVTISDLVKEFARYGDGNLTVKFDCVGGGFTTHSSTASVHRNHGSFESVESFLKMQLQALISRKIDPDAPDIPESVECLKQHAVWRERMQKEHKSDVAPEALGWIFYNDPHRTVARLPDPKETELFLACVKHYYFHLERSYATVCLFRGHTGVNLGTGPWADIKADLIKHIERMKSEETTPVVE